MRGSGPHSRKVIGYPLAEAWQQQVPGLEIMKNLPELTLGLQGQHCFDKQLGSISTFLSLQSLAISNESATLTLNLQLPNPKAEAVLGGWRRTAPRCGGFTRVFKLRDALISL